MSYSFIKKPHYVKPADYESAIKKIVGILRKESAILSIYRLGNVNHPGVSDIDLIVVFKNDEKCFLNIHDHLSTEEKYLLTHEIGGVPEKLFSQVYSYSFWDNLELIWGKNHLVENLESQEKVTKNERYKEQLGLEFLIKNSLELAVQTHYGVIKSRSLLQEIKGIRYDIGFLNLQGSALEAKVQSLLNQLDHWFSDMWKAEEFSFWLNDYNQILQDTIQGLSLDGRKIWMPENEHYQYGRNVTIKKGDNFGVRSTGIFLPAWIVSKHKKLYNAHTRLNGFEIEIDFTTKDTTGMNHDRMALIKECINYNREWSPHFGTVLSSFSTHFI